MRDLLGRFFLFVVIITLNLAIKIVTVDEAVRAMQAVYLEVHQ